jgi:hypothetical protein
VRWALSLDMDAFYKTCVRVSFLAQYIGLCTSSFCILYKILDLRDF